MPVSPREQLSRHTMNSLASLRDNEERKHPMAIESTGLREVFLRFNQFPSCSTTNLQRDGS